MYNGDQIGYDENLFPKIKSEKKFKIMNYGALAKQLDALNWEHRLDEDDIESDYYSFKKGEIWLGGK